MISIRDLALTVQSSLEESTYWLLTVNKSLVHRIKSCEQYIPTRSIYYVLVMFFVQYYKPELVALTYSSYLTLSVIRRIIS